MVIDIHAHWTTAPAELGAFRAKQLATLNKPDTVPAPRISDDQLRGSVQDHLEQMAARGIDVLCFSPQASAMGHDQGDLRTSEHWSRVNNDLIRRIADLYPDHFAPVCQLPQSPGEAPATVLGELNRCVEELGFVGCNINPDASGGLPPWTPPLGSPEWYPVWERLCELDVPAMIHASATRNPALHVNGSHYIAQDYAAVVELCSSSVFADFPQLRLIVPHGGGAIPFQFNRHRSLHLLQGLAPFEEAVSHLWFDTAVYDADSLEMLVRKIGPHRVVFGSEMFGTAKGADPQTGRLFDDNRDHIEALPGLDDETRQLVLSGNARALFPRARDVFDRAEARVAA